MNRLTIDTTNRTEIIIKLQAGTKTDEIKEAAKSKSQIALILIDQILKRNKLSPTDIDEILVNSGPGSFTGTRVGVAIANALGFGLSIKVNGKESVTPKYN